MIFPLGLGTKLPRFPYLTVLLSLSTFAFYVYDKKNYDSFSEKFFKIEADSGMQEATKKLFCEYCANHGGEKEKCELYSIIFTIGYIGASELNKDDNTKKDTDKKKIEKEKTNTDLESFLTYLLASESLENKKKGSTEYKYRKIVDSFFQKTTKPDAAFKKLSSYNAYSASDSSLEEKKERLNREGNYYSKNSDSVKALFLAQLRHGNYMHIIGNLFMLVVFGIYVEQRANPIIYLLTYFLGGSLGLYVQSHYFEPANTICLGASANVFAIMGMFFVFFINTRMKFLIWVVVASKKMWAPVKISFPILFIASELAAGITQQTALSSSNVAHIAHLNGLLVGILAALALNYFKRLPWPFIYASEIKQFKQLTKIDSPEQKAVYANRLLAYNSENIFVRVNTILSLVGEIIKNKENNDKIVGVSCGKFITENLDCVCAVAIKNKKLPVVYQLLSGIPLEMQLGQYFGRLGPVNIIRLGDFALGQGDLFLALRLYDAYMQRYPKSIIVNELRLTAREIVNAIPQDERTLIKLERYLTVNFQTAFYSIIGEKIVGMKSLTVELKKTGTENA